MYALKKFHQFLYGRKFIVVTDHKPLVTLFAPDKGTPAMAANRLARWALLVHQYDYTVEYRRSKDHGNADALSRLPFSNDTSFDGEEMEDDFDSVCLVRTISRQINPDNPLLVVRETAKDRRDGRMHFRKSLKTSKSWKIRCQQRMVAFFTAYG